jgi:hypothetical protein
MEQFWSVLSVVVGAALAYLSGLLLDQRARKREDRIRSTTDFCRSLMTYAGRQLREVADRLESRPEPPEMAQARRASREETWASYLHVVLVIDDDAAARQCRDALECARTVDDAKTWDDAKERAEAVRWAAEQFVHTVAKKLRVAAGSLQAGI